MILHNAGKYNGDENTLPQREHHPNAVPLKEIESMKQISLITNVGCILTIIILAIPFILLSKEYIKDKFEKTGLTAVKSEHANAPIITEYPVCMECRALEVDGEYGVLGEIVNLSIDEKYLDENGNSDFVKMNTIAYDPFTHGYYEVTKKVGQAFSDGKKLM